jgi:hypothetical protein
MSLMRKCCCGGGAGGNTDACADGCCPEFFAQILYIVSDYSASISGTLLQLSGYGPEIGVGGWEITCGLITRGEDGKWRFTIYFTVDDSATYATISGDLPCPSSGRTNWVLESYSGPSLFLPTAFILQIVCCSSSVVWADYPYGGVPSVIKVTGLHDAFLANNDLTDTTTMPLYTVWDETLTLQSTGPYAGLWLASFPLSIRAANGRYFNLGGLEDISNPGMTISPNIDFSTLYAFAEAGGLTLVLSVGATDMSAGFNGIWSTLPCISTWYNTLTLVSNLSGYGQPKQLPIELQVGPP